MIAQKPPMPPARQDMPAGHHTARRAGLLTEMTARRRGPGRRRLTIGGLGAAGLAGGVAAAMIAVPDAGQGDGDVPTPTRVVPVSAAVVLDRAAATAGQATEPRPDQYVYTVTESRAYDSGMVREQSWRSVSGKRIGFRIDSWGKRTQRFWLCEALGSMRQEEVTPAKAPADCENEPFYRRRLPSDAKAMRDWLYKTDPTTAGPRDVRAFHYVHEIIAGRGLTPEAQAAMFKATGMIPGVKVYQSGSESIAVGQAWNHSRFELLFEPKTYRFIGTRQVVDHDRTFQPKDGKPGARTPAGEVDPSGRKARATSLESPYARMKQGAFLFDHMIVSQRVVDAIPAKYFKRPS